MNTIPPIILSFIFTMVMYGQGDNYKIASWDDQFMISWAMAYPTDHDFLDRPGVYGVRFDYRTLGSKNIAFGFSSGWNSYQQKIDQQLYENETGSRQIYTDMIRRVFELPITMNAFYYFGSSPTFRPYMGIGFGTMFSQQEAHFNIYSLEEVNWGFLLRPELGAQLYFSRGFGLHFYGLFSHATNQNDSFDIKKLEHLGIGLGLFWML